MTSHDATSSGSCRFRHRSRERARERSEHPSPPPHHRVTPPKISQSRNRTTSLADRRCGVSPPRGRGAEPNRTRADRARRIARLRAFLLPSQKTCYASIEELETIATPLIEKHFGAAAAADGPDADGALAAQTADDAAPGKKVRRRRRARRPRRSVVCLGRHLATSETDKPAPRASRAPFAGPLFYMQGGGGLVSRRPFDLLLAARRGFSRRRRVDPSPTLRCPRRVLCFPRARASAAVRRAAQAAPQHRLSEGGVSPCAHGAEGSSLLTEPLESNGRTGFQKDDAIAMLARLVGPRHKARDSSMRSSVASRG